MGLTDEQRKAVEQQGRIIVSASAGSGKTTVMIRRLVELIRTGGASVKNVLAVTFTNKAAAQMRDKMRRALSEEIVACEDGARKAKLTEELQALPLAEICTIHAFCGHLVRTYFYCAGGAGEEIQPDFKILTPDEAKSLSLRAMNEVFERAYEEKGEDFRLLLSSYYGKHDLRLRELIAGFYGKVRGYANYREILLNAGADTFDASVQYVAARYRERCASVREDLEKLRAYFEKTNPKAAEVCGKLLDAAEAVIYADGLFEMKNCLLPQTRMPSGKKAEGEEKFKLKKLGRLNNAIKNLYAEIEGIGSEETERARAQEAARRAAAIGKIVLEYDRAYSACKREAGALDYDDLEHFAYALLSNEEVKREVQSRFSYVFVDEYQDVNPMQEAIIGQLANKNLFLVGDEKQAIYGFRGSKSKFFIRTEREYAAKGCALKLTENFRSAPEILKAVNRVFSELLTGYTPMRGGSRFGEHGGEILSYLSKKTPKEERELGVYSVLSGGRASEKNALADTVVKIVEAERGKQWFDPDANDGAGEEKTVDYGDITVLVRANSGAGERIVRALSDRGIPVTASAEVNICAFFEARLLIDWLSFLDNAEQDIPLAGAMLSRIGGFTDDELAQIRLAAEGAPSFRAAVRRCGGALKAKTDAFFKKTDRLRAISRVRTAAETMNLLLSEGLEVQIACKPDGKNRLARVRRLVSEGEGLSVRAFLNKLKELEEHIDFTESGGENAVKVMTMHASKGLEFPVVILASLSADVAKTDAADVIFADGVSQGGETALVAPKSFDAQTKTTYETLVRRAAAAYNTREEEEGERNLLYVAMTRAQYRLCLVFEEESEGGKRKSDRYSDYFDESFLPQDTEFSEAGGGKRESVQSGRAYPLADLYRAVEAAGGYRKKYKDASRLPMKSSATAIMHAANAETKFYPADEEAPFVQNEELAPSSQDEGLAYHAFLQFVRFGAPVKDELARMRREGLLSEEYLALLGEEKLEKILAMPCFRGIAEKSKWREQKFLLSVPANEIASYRTEARDEIVFQGAIDLLYFDGNGYTVVDYKYSALSGEALKEKYASQIGLYRKAVAKGKRVDEEKVRASIVNIRRLEEIPF